MATFHDCELVEPSGKVSVGVDEFDVRVKGSADIFDAGRVLLYMEINGTRVAEKERTEEFGLTTFDFTVTLPSPFDTNYLIGSGVQNDVVIGIEDAAFGSDEMDCGSFELSNNLLPFIDTQQYNVSTSVNRAVATMLVQNNSAVSANITIHTNVNGFTIGDEGDIFLFLDPGEFTNVESVIDYNLDPGQSVSDRICLNVVEAKFIGGI